MDGSTQPQHGDPQEIPQPVQTPDASRASYQTSYQAPSQNNSPDPNESQHQILVQAHNTENQSQATSQSQEATHIIHQAQPQFHGAEYLQDYVQNQPQVFHQDQIQNLPDSQVPNFATNPSAPIQPFTKTSPVRQKYYKPMSTGTPVLISYLVASLIFLAGLEVVVRRGVPVSPSTSTTTTTKIQRRLFGAPAMPKCIGIEMIVSVTSIEQCSSTSCAATATYQKPIFDVPIPTMPCYVCAIEEQGIETDGWITATTTQFASAASQGPATIYPCSTCEGTVLTATPVWEITPTWSAKPFTTYGKHTHGEKKQTRPTSI